MLLLSAANMSKENSVALPVSETGGYDLFGKDRGSHYADAPDVHVYFGRSLEWKDDGDVGRVSKGEAFAGGLHYSMY